MLHLPFGDIETCGWAERSETHHATGDQPMTSYRRNFAPGAS